MNQRYKVPGTAGLYIDGSHNIYSNSVSDQYKLLDNGVIRIIIYGKKQTLKLSNLFEIARRNMFIAHNEIIKHLDQFYFISREVKHLGLTKIKYTGLLTKPIEVLFIGRIFRVVSDYPRLAIDSSGLVLDLKNSKVIRSNSVGNDKNYPSIKLEVDDGKYTTKAIHRLVAFAWCDNDDPDVQITVNHIDGDKNNYHPTNLEWCSHRYNNIHAVEIGLKDENIAVKIKNIKTGVVSKFRSLTDATNFIGRSRISINISNPILTNRIVYGTNGEYEIKYMQDVTPWLIDTNPKKLIRDKQIMRLIILHNGKKYYCNSSEDIQEVIDNNKDIPKTTVSRSMLYTACNEFLKRYPNIPARIEYLEENRHSNYLYRNSETDEVFSATDRKEIMEATGGSKSTIQKSISTNGAYAINNIWYAKFDDGKEFAVPAVIANKPIPVKVVNGDSEVIYSSVREAAVALNVDKKTIARALKFNKFINGHTLTYTH